MRQLTYGDLDGWSVEDHAAALRTFCSTCMDLYTNDWRTICSGALSHPDPRRFFETYLRPVLLTDGHAPLFTGYHEPVIAGARERSARFFVPVYGMPPEARENRPWLTRRMMHEQDSLAGRGLEIAWVDDPVEMFFLQVQGCGRIALDDGRVLRVGYAGTNGHPYRSIGQELVRRGIYQADQVSASAIKSWVRRNPSDGLDLLFHNPSYVFFREVNDLPPDQGPLGTMGRPLAPMRSVAVDPAFVPLGTPVWIETDGQHPTRRLMIAQDTGSAIKGAQRADIFFGTGDAAGHAAGQLRDPGRMVVLLPPEQAQARASGQKR